MAAVIRLARHGGKKNPFYRIVVADRRYAGDGRRSSRWDSTIPAEAVAHRVQGGALAEWLQARRAAERDRRPADQEERRAAARLEPRSGETLHEGTGPVPGAPLVNNPDAVEVKETQGDTASVLELKVAKEDLGRIIGKQGRTAKSIRTILNAAASRTNRKVVLEIVEEQ